MSFTHTWPDAEGIWIANLPADAGGGEFPLMARELKDDLPSIELLALEAANPEMPKVRRTLAIIAQWPESEKHWPFTFQSCHPVKEWRKPTDEELTKAKAFYGIK